MLFRSSDKPAAYVSPEEQSDLAALLKNIVLTVNGLWGFNHAIVTRGGVSLREIEPGTMRSKLCDNLYFACRLCSPWILPCSISSMKSRNALVTSV